MSATSNISALSQSLRTESQDTQLSTLLFRDSQVIMTPLPASGISTSETTTLCFPSVEILERTLMQPLALNEEVVKKVITKLTTLGGRDLYPSQIAHLLFELAFTDFEGIRLTPKQRTDNMAYILRNLGCGRPEIIEKLFAFYYGYSFEHFAPKKD